jgi:hypothetical protein
MGNRDVYEPSAQEIALATAEIQATWDQTTERIRSGAVDDRWMPPGTQHVLTTTKQSREQ